MYLKALVYLQQAVYATLVFIPLLHSNMTIFDIKFVMILILLSACDRYLPYVTVTKFYTYLI